MRSLGHMPVDRVNRLKAGQMLTDSKNRIEDTRSTLVFPEETYGPSDDLLPFQRGGFLLALKTDIPILPVGIQGTRSALPPNGRLVAPTELTVRFGEPIATADRTVSDRDQLMDHTRNAIRELSGLALHLSDEGSST
jgi:1-acyl-sn-glycerol-3-phosphate acyltransferase